MAATTGNKDDESKATETTNTKSTSTSSTRKKSASSEEPAREELKGVLRTSRVGKLSFGGATSGSTPDELADRRHEKLEEALKPGDEGYNAFTDPMVPSSTLAQIITTELAAEDATESPTWNALNEAYQDQHEERVALKEWREKRRAS